MNKLVLFLAAIFSTFLCVPSHAQVIVGNFGVNYVTATPSGSCSSNAPIESVIGSGEVYSCQDGNWAEIGGGGSSITLTTTGTSGAATLVDGVLNIPVYSGGGTPATPVQSPQINQQGSFGSQQNVYVAWSGDTLTSLASVCASNPSTIEVSAPLTLVPTVATALPADCNISFLGNGEFVNNTAYKITINGKVNSDAPVERFGGTGTFGLGAVNTLVPVEWFGAVAGGSASANLTAIQATINALTIGQPYLSGNYPIAGTLTINQSSVCLAGPPAGRGGYVGGLTETVAGDDALDIHGTSTTYVDFGVCENFFISSSVAQTGTVAGLSASFTGGLTVRNVVSSDFFYPFYIHASPSYQSGGFYNDVAQWYTLSSAMTSPVGFYLDSADGNAESSLILEHNAVAAPATGGPSQPWGLVASGVALNDWLSTDLNVAFVNGVQLNYTGSGTNIGCSDIHLVDTTIDNFLTYGMQIENLSGNCTPSWEVSGGWIYVGPSTAVTGSYLMDIENSSNGTISHTLQGAHSGQSQSLHGDYVNGASSTNVVFTGNSYYNQANAIDFNGSNGNAATGNSATGNGNIDFSATNGATYNSFVGNQMTEVGSGGIGIYIPIGNNYNTYVGNTCNSAGAATCISDGGTGNGAGYLGNVTVGNVTGPLNLTLSSTASSLFGSDLAPNAANSTIWYGCYGVNTTFPNCLNKIFNYTSSGSAANSVDWKFTSATSTNIHSVANYGTAFGETTPSTPPANGIAVGTAGQFQVSGAGAVTAPGYISGGTTFTASGCTNSTLVGGATAGSYDSGTTGTCTVTVTMGGSLTAPHGWSCSVHDLTTPADTQQQTATAAGTATFSGTTVSGDVVNFGCIGY